MFKANNKDTRTITLNILHTPCPSVSTVNFEHVNADLNEHNFRHGLETELIPCPNVVNKMRQLSFPLQFTFIS